MYRRFYNWHLLSRAFWMNVLMHDEWFSDYETEPYHYRPCPDLGHDYNREYDTIVGASVAWNQLFNGMDKTTNDGITVEYHSDTHKITITNDSRTTNYSSGSNRSYIAENLILGHKYAFLFNPIVTGVIAYNPYVTPSNFPAIWNCNASEVYMRITKDYNFVNDHPVGDVTTLELQIVDLTLALGSTIADYIYTLEQGTAGAGVAFLKKYFPCLDEYNAYDAGSIQSVSGLVSHDTVGFNQWDEEWEVGSIGGSGETTTDNTRIRSKNFIPILPNTAYRITCSANDGRIAFYDADKNFVSISYSAGPWTSGFTTSASARYMKFSPTSAYGTTYKNDICINISDASINGQYFPYEKHSYALDSTITLRGKFNLVDGKLVADGDIYPPSGEGATNYAEVDLGGLDWNYESGNQRFNSSGIESLVDKSGSDSWLSNLVCSKYAVASGGGTDKTIGVFRSTGRIYAFDSAYTDKDTFKASLAGVKLLYPLATPTTFSATPYTSPQACDPSGTEEYVSTSIVPIGHQTRYKKA